jgi:hypothetical protein
MAGDDDPVGGSIKTAVSLMMRRVARKTHRVERGASLFAAVVARLG